MTERTGSPLEKTHIKKSHSSPEGEVRKTMTERTGSPLEKTHIKKSHSSPEGEVRKTMTQRTGSPLEKTHIKKSHSSPEGEVRKTMPERTGSPLEKTHIKKYPPSQEEGIKKTMPERTGSPLKKTHIKKSHLSQEEGIRKTINRDNIPLEKTVTEKPGEPPLMKKKIIKKIIKSPSGEIITTERKDKGEIKKEEEKKSIEVLKKQDTLLEKTMEETCELWFEIQKEKLEEKKETKILKEQEITVNNNIIRSLLPAENIQEEIKEKVITSDFTNKERSSVTTVTLSIKEKKEDNLLIAHGEFIHTCLEKVIELGASDLHLSTGQKPIVRCRGELQDLPMPPLTEENTEGLLRKILSMEEKDRLSKQQSIDFMYIMQSKEGPPHRFRSNAYYHRSGLNVVMRIIPNKIPTIKDLGMPDILSAFGRFHQGLVLVTGSTGSGKTTTLAALIDLINTERNDHIVTIEDPIEFIHKPKRCIVRQRQVGVHTKNYNRALKSSIREDPDVILVSELRDLETIQLAMTAAETGCLVLSTMSTTSAARTIDRIIDFFPADQRLQAGAMLSDSLRAIISQQLIPSSDRTVRHASVEILIGCTPLSSLIREQKTFQISSLLETSRGLGMQSMDSSLMSLLENKMITYEVAHEAALDKTILEQFANSLSKKEE
jgi:twitching motility protein PilT